MAYYPYIRTAYALRRPPNQGTPTGALAAGGGMS
jgi:hypothetical protein